MLTEHGARALACVAIIAGAAWIGHPFVFLLACVAAVAIVNDW